MKSDYSASVNQELTKREIEVVQLIADGLTNTQMAERLFIAVSTLKNHISNIYKKLGCHNQGHAVAYCFRKGLIK